MDIKQLWKSGEIGNAVYNLAKRDPEYAENIINSVKARKNLEIERAIIAYRNLFNEDPSVMKEVEKVIDDFKQAAFEVGLDRGQGGSNETKSLIEKLLSKETDLKNKIKELQS